MFGGGGHGHGYGHGVPYGGYGGGFGYNYNNRLLESNFSHLIIYCLFTAVTLVMGEVSEAIPMAAMAGKFKSFKGS